MPVVVACQCGQRFAARDDLAGKTVACPTCGGAITVPIAANTPASVPAQAAAPKSPLVVECSCGQRCTAREDLIGKTLPCPTCGQPIVVGAGDANSAAPAPTKLAPAKAAPTPPAPAPTITVACQCGARFAARADLAGKRVACPSCKQPLAIPATSPNGPAQSAAVKPAASKGGVADLLDELGVQPSKTGIRCTHCQRDMQPGTHLCVHCGFDHQSGTKLEMKKWR